MGDNFKKISSNGDIRPEIKCDEYENYGEGGKTIVRISFLRELFNEELLQYLNSSENKTSKDIAIKIRELFGAKVSFEIEQFSLQSKYKRIKADNYLGVTYYKTSDEYGDILTIQGRDYFAKIKNSYGISASNIKIFIDFMATTETITLEKLVSQVKACFSEEARLSVILKTEDGYKFFANNSKIEVELNISTTEKQLEKVHKKFYNIFCEEPVISTREFLSEQIVIEASGYQLTYVCKDYQHITKILYDGVRCSIQKEMYDEETRTSHIYYAGPSMVGYFESIHEEMLDILNNNPDNKRALSGLLELPQRTGKGLTNVQLSILQRICKEIYYAESRR